MASSVLEGVQRDRMAWALARAVVLANAAAVARGFDPDALRVSIEEESVEGVPCWHVYYEPRDSHKTRGGDLSVYVERDGSAVRRVLIGQ